MFNAIKAFLVVTLFCSFGSALDKKGVVESKQELNDSVVELLQNLRKTEDSSKQLSVLEEYKKFIDHQMFNHKLKIDAAENEFLHMRIINFYIAFRSIDFSKVSIKECRKNKVVIQAVDNHSGDEGLSEKTFSDGAQATNEVLSVLCEKFKDMLEQSVLDSNPNE